MDRWGFGCGLFVDGLAQFIEFIIHRGFCLGPGLMAQVDGIGQQAAALTEPLSISAFLEVDAFGFEEVFDVSEQFFVIDFVHNNLRQKQVPVVINPLSKRRLRIADFREGDNYSVRGSL